MLLTSLFRGRDRAFKVYKELKTTLCVYANVEKELMFNSISLGINKESKKLNTSLTKRRCKK